MKTDTQTKNETTNLKVGDEVCTKKCSGSWRRQKDFEYTFSKVERTTNKLAILENSTRIKNTATKDFNGAYCYSEQGDIYKKWIISTPELKQEAKRQKMNNWFNYKANAREFTDKEIEIIYEKFKELNLIKEE